jgi:hypothetical protein
MREEGEYLWNWFCQISMGISSAGFGVPAVTWENVQCWKTLMRVEIDPWEAALMVRLGQLRASILSEPEKKR